MALVAAHRTTGETQRHEGATSAAARFIVTLIVVAGVAAMTATDSVRGGALDRGVATSIIARTNAVRADAGLAPLATHDALVRSAERYAREMAATDRIEHFGAGGTTPDMRAEAAGYGGWTIVAENLSSSAGAPDAAPIVAAWMASEAHRANILAPDIADAGAACYVVRGGRSWCVLEFGAR